MKKCKDSLIHTLNTLTGVEQKTHSCKMEVKTNRQLHYNNNTRFITGRNIKISYEQDPKLPVFKFNLSFLFTKFFQ